MQYQNTPQFNWAAGVVSRVFNVTLDDVINQWAASGVIDISGKEINVNHMFQGESYRETVERYSSVLEYKVESGRSTVCVRDGAVLSVEDINPIAGRIYAVLLDKSSGVAVFRCWIEVEIYTRQTIIYTKN